MEAIILIIVLIVAVIILAGVAGYMRGKRLKEIEQQYSLIVGETYDVLVNNGASNLGLIYRHIGYGNNSKNGNINLYFYKRTKYRGQLINREVMIKYGNIWKVTKVSNNQTIEIDEE